MDGAADAAIAVVAAVWLILSGGTMTGSPIQNLRSKSCSWESFFFFFSSEKLRVLTGC